MMSSLDFEDWQRESNDDKEHANRECTIEMWLDGEICSLSLITEVLHA